METEINGGNQIPVIQDVIVQNKAGLHLRPSAQIVKAMADLNCEITLRKDKKRVNAKSIMSVTTLIAPKGTVITIEAVGPDAKAAVEALVNLFQSKFGEE
jgi:phosphocarrier protein HPr